MSEKKYKTPDELGEAVGLKIEELFGTMVHDLPPEEPEPQSTVQEQREKVPVAPTSPPSTPGSTPREARSPRGSIAASPPSSSSNPQEKAGNTCAEILERIEILMLKLEWEVNPESVREIFQKFMELERFFSADRSAMNILAMNRRVLPRFKDPEAVPHRSLLKLLQDSITALKGIHSSQGRQRPSDKLLASITNSYKEIVSSLPVSGAASKSMGETKEQGSKQRYASLISDFGGTIRSINDVNRRLGKILGVLRQGGGMSGEEISRRLGALENLIAQRVDHLSTVHNELVHIGAPTDAISAESGHNPRGAETRPDGLLMITWGGAFLAISSSIVAALYPLSKAQTQQMQHKSSIVIGGRPIQRIPLKKPQGAQAEPTTLSAWLTHVSWDQHDYFLLADKLLGYRKTPEGVDIAGQTKIKIGPTGYTLIDRRIFRRTSSATQG